MRTITAAILLSLAAGAGAGDREHYYKDLYLGMPLAEFEAAFGDDATLTGEGAYTYTGYPEEEVELVFAEVLGSPCLTSITVNAVIDYSEEVLPTLIALYGEPEYDSRWVPAHTDCNKGDGPVRSVYWYRGFDVDLRMTALEDFRSPEPPVSWEVRCWFALADGAGRDGPHPWLEEKLAAQ